MGQTATVTAGGAAPSSVFSSASRPMGVHRLAGSLALVAAGMIGVVLAVVFAAALAVIVVLAAALIGLTGVALRGRRRPPVGGDDNMVIEARKVGHSWVAYGWDQRPG